MNNFNCKRKKHILKTFYTGIEELFFILMVHVFFDKLSFHTIPTQ